MSLQTITTANEEEFDSQGTALLKTKIVDAIVDHGFCIVGLSGGSTPKPIYEALGKEKEIDWSKVWLFLVDDRYIRSDDPQSNQFLLRSTLLKNAPIPESQLILPDTTLPLDQCIAQYEAWMRALLAKGKPDAITFGLGDDGHIASLFPPVPEEAFDDKLVIHTTTDRFAVHDRISVTMPVLTRAREAVFFLKGSDKKRVWEEMLRSGEDARKWPAKAILESVETTAIVA